MVEYTGKDFVSTNEGTQTFNRLGRSAARECSDVMGAPDKKPCDQIQPKIVVDLGQMTVFVADSRRLQRLSASRMRDQLEMSSRCRGQW